MFLVLMTPAVASSPPSSVDGQLAPGAAALEPASATVDGWLTLGTLEFPEGERLPFEETVRSRILKTPVTARGELWLTGDGSLTLLVKEPRLEERTLAATELRLRRLRPGVDPEAAEPKDWRTRRISLERERPALVLLRAIAQLINGDVDALRSSFELTATEQSMSLWRVTLRPRHAALAERLPFVELEGRGDQLRSIHADRGADGAQTVRLLDRVEDKIAAEAS